VDAKYVKDVIKLWKIITRVPSLARHQYLQNETIILPWPILAAARVKFLPVLAPNWYDKDRLSKPNVY
jgi:hypothetical protein